MLPVVNILLVEDDEEICEILQFYLMEKEEYNVTITHSAEQARNLIKMRRFDLVLLDIQLPGIDGIDFCAELRTVSNCPVIFISCINDDLSSLPASRPTCGGHRRSAQSTRFFALVRLKWIPPLELFARMGAS